MAEAGVSPAPTALGADPVRIIEVVRALQEMTEAINQEAFDLDAILHMVARNMCAILGVGRCTAYVKEASTGLYRGRVMETSERGGHWDEAVRRLTCGVEADRFTAEIVSTSGPVFLSDPQVDPRAIRATMRNYGVRSMLGVPMVAREEVTGLLFLDDLERPHAFSDAESEIAVTFANLAATAISQAAAAEELRTNLTTIARQNKILRHSSAVEIRLGRMALEGAGLPELTQAIAELTDRPCAVYDTDLALLAAGHPSPDAAEASVPPPALDRVPAVRAAVSGLEAGGSIVAGPHLPALPCRVLVVSVLARDEPAGYIAIQESAAAFKAIDLAAARRAATIVGLSISTRQWAAETRAHARELLVRDLIAGADEDAAVRARARFCRMDVDRPHVVCLLRRGGDDRPGPIELEAARDALDGEGLATVAGDGLVLLLELDDEPLRHALRTAKATIDGLLHRLAPHGGFIGTISTPCRSVRDYRRGYDEARQLMRSVQAVGSTYAGHDVVTADDLGAARLLLSATDHGEAERFARDTLGPLLNHHDSHTADLVSTLTAYFECSRSIRACASQLRIHENTVRYRLSRVSELTGLEVASSASDQLVAQVALLVLRLRHGLTSDPGPATTP